MLFVKLIMFPFIISRFFVAIRQCTVCICGKLKTYTLLAKIRAHGFRCCGLPCVWPAWRGMWYISRNGHKSKELVDVDAMLLKPRWTTAAHRLTMNDLVTNLDWKYWWILVSMVGH